MALLLGAEWFDDRPGGLNRYVRDLSEALRRTGHEHRVVVVSEAAGAPAAWYAAGAADRPLPERLLRYARTARRAAAGARVVDAHFALYAAVPLLLPPLRRCRTVVHFHGPWADESLVTTPRARAAAALKWAIERQVYRRADELIVLSDAFRAVLERRYGVSSWRIHVVPPAVDLDRFRPGDRGTARASLGLPATAFVAVVARRLEARMGIDVLLEAWRGVIARRPDSMLLVVGTGSQAEALQVHAADMGVARSVRFVGRLSDDQLEAAYQAADVSVVPTRTLEGFGLVVLESLAAGTPVVVTDAGGLPEALRGFDDAAIVPAGCAEPLTEALVRAADGTGPSRRACREHAERFSFDALAERHAAIFRGGGDRLRVLYVDHCAQWSGGELALARLLPALGVHAHVVLGEDGPLVRLLHDQGVPVEVMPVDGAVAAVRKDDVRPRRIPWRSVVASLRTVWRLQRRIRQLHPDVVHTNSLKAALYGGLAGRLAGVPVVWHVRDRIEQDYLPAPAVRLVRIAARVLPSAVIANSAATLATLRGLRQPTAVVASPVDAPMLPERRLHGDGELVVAMIGRLAPWKGQHVFLEAFARAFPERGARAVIVGGALFGEDGYEARLRADVQRLGLAGRVELTGHLECVDAALADADILVHASTSPEPFGQVVVQGMGAGVPVIASAAGGPAEIVHDGVDGLLHPPGDVSALARCLRRLADDTDLRRALAAAGRERSRDFSAERLAPMVHAVYDAVRTHR